MPLLDLAHIRLLALVADATQCLILEALDRGDWESAFRLTTLAFAANVRNTLVQERNIRRTLSYISREVDSWVDQEKVEKGRRLLEEMNARADELVGIRAVEFGGTSFDSIYTKIDAELDPLIDALRVHQYVFDWSRIESILGSLTEDERRRAVRGKLGIPEAFQNTLDLPFVTLVLTARESAQFSHRIRDELAAREARSIGTGLTLSDMASSSLDVWDQLLGTGRPPEPPG